MAVNTGLPTNTSVYGLAIDPSSPQTVYSGSAGRGVFRSTHGGNSWAAVNAGLLLNARILSLAMARSSPPTVYAVTTIAGIFAIQFPQSETGLVSDFNSDGKVDFDDFFLFAAAFGARKGDPGFAEKFDLNVDGAVNFDDFFIFAAEFGRTTK